ncbi:hypothetical protein Hanom_Chr05g00415891 [Helianthus anomalus]
MGDDDGKSVGINKEGHNMANDVEDGEIRSPECSVPSPVMEVRSPTAPQVDPLAVPLDVSVHDQSPFFEKLDNERVLHEAHGGKIGECSKPWESNYNNEGTNDLAAKGVDGGPILQEERDCNVVGQFDQFGPTPLSGLGKRSRAHRSPPSSGSMNGPPNRGFFQDPPAEDLPFDLNRPSSLSGSRSEDNFGVDGQGYSEGWLGCSIAG